MIPRKPRGEFIFGYCENCDTDTMHLRFPEKRVCIVCGMVVEYTIKNKKKHNKYGD